MVACVAAALAGAGEVVVEATGAGADDRAVAVEEAGGVEDGERGQAVAARFDVDVEDVGGGFAGGDGDVVVGSFAPPGADLVWVGGGVFEAVFSGGVFAAGAAGERPCSWVAVGAAEDRSTLLC